MFATGAGKFIIVGDWRRGSRRGRHVKRAAESPRGAAIIKGLDVADDLRYGESPI